MYESYSELKRCSPFFRRFANLLFAFIVVAKLATTSATDKHMLIENNIKGLKIIDATSAEFQNELAKLLNPDIVSKIVPVLPFSLIVVNDTGRYLYSFTVVYTYPNRIAPSGTPWKFVVSPTAGSPDDRRTMIAPGDHYLVTPLSDFIASRNASGQKLASPYFDEGMERLVVLFQSDDAKQRIDVSVDSMIFEDGQLVGPDVSNRLDKVNARIRAERDLVKDIQGLHGDDLRRKLIAESEPTSEDREYSNFKTRSARYLLRVLGSRGEPAALERSEKLAAVKWFSNPEGVRKTEQ